MEIRKPAREMTFGVEIETSVPAGAVRVGGYRAGTRVATLPEGWQAKTDCSIRPEMGHQGAEFVSPILRGPEGIRSIVAAVEAINAMGGKVNSSCGFHVHVGFDRNDRDGLERLVTLTSNFERAIYASTGTRAREIGTFCRPVQHYGTADVAIAQSTASRYHVLNLNNLLGGGHGYETVEFRAFAGTLNPVKIVGYVWLCLGLAERAVNAGRRTGWTAKEPVATSPIHRAGEGQTALTRLYYQLGWTKGRTDYAFGVLSVEGAPDLKTVKTQLMKMARKYDTARDVGNLPG